MNHRVVYVHSSWAIQDVAFSSYNSAYPIDVSVVELVGKRAELHPERTQTLLQVLGVDMKWRLQLV